MTGISRETVSRRGLLAGVGATALAGVGVATLRGYPILAQPGTPSLAIRAVTAWGDGFAALVGADDHAVTVHPLRLGGDRQLTVDPPLAVRWPHEFQPWGIAATGNRLWVTGSMASLFEVVAVDNRTDAVPEELREMAGEGDPDLPDAIVDYEVWHYRPAVFTIEGEEGERVEPVEILVPELGWGSATGVATDGTGTIAVAMDGNPDPDAHVISRCHLAVSTDGGSTWRQGPLDRALGEGFATTVVATGESLVALTVNGGGIRTRRAGRLGAGLRLDHESRIEGLGPVHAAVADGSGGVDLVTESAGRRIIAVNGLSNTWITVTGAGARLVTR